MKFLRGQISLELFAVVCFLILATAWYAFHGHSEPARKVASEPIALMEGEQWGPQNDEQAQQIILASEQMLQQRTGGATLMKRDAHPKQHGCARAVVQMDSRALPKAYQVGIFTAPAEGAPYTEYQAWARFSNGSPGGKDAPDLDKDIRGFALKLMNVRGSDSGSQDFLLTTSSEFFSKNGKEYASFHRALARGNWFFLPWLVAHPQFAERLLKARVQIGNVLQADYFSTVPYRFGLNHSMRFSTRACTLIVNRDHLPEKSDQLPNFLHTRLVQSLSGGATECFEFYVQPNEFPSVQPIEDPTVAWDEKISPLYRVGKIIFQAGQTDLDSENINSFCENLSFSPWHSFPETRPVGQINRIRRLVYTALSADRHDHNSLRQKEPQDFNPCNDPQSEICKIIR